MALAQNSEVAVGDESGAKASAVRHRRYWIYSFLFLLSVVAYIDRVSISVGAKAIATEFHLSPIDMGYLFSAFFWSYLVCLVPIGIIADRWGARRTISYCIALWSVMTAAAGVVTTMPLLMLSRLGLGIGESVVFPAGNRVLREWAPAKERGIASTIFIAGSYAGPAFGAALLGWVVTSFGWRAGFYVAGGVGIAYWLMWTIFYRRPEEVSWIDADERAKIVSERNTRAAESAKRRKPLGVFGLLQSKTMWGLALAHGCGIYSQYLYLTWLPTYLVTVRGLSILTAGFYIAIPYLAAAMLNVVLGYTSDHLLDTLAANQGRRRNLMAGLKIVSAIILFVPFIESTIMIMVVITISLSALAAAISLHYALMHDLLLDSANAGKASSIIAFGGNSFGMMAPIATGYIIAGTGSYNWAFFVAGILLVLGAGLLILWARKPIDEHAELLQE
jgi:MFS family permease